MSGLCFDYELYCVIFVQKKSSQPALMELHALRSKLYLAYLQWYKKLMISKSSATAFQRSPKFPKSYLGPLLRTLLDQEPAGPLSEEMWMHTVSQPIELRRLCQSVDSLLPSFRKVFLFQQTLARSPTKVGHHHGTVECRLPEYCFNGV